MLRIFTRVFQAFTLLVMLTSNTRAAVDQTPNDFTIAIVGDSVTQGYGVEPEQAFPALLEKKLLSEGKNVRVLNGGVSGSLSSSAASRVRWFLKQRPQLIVIELGGNDALKGTDPGVIEKNLSEAISLADAQKVPVLLLGMKIFTSFGKEYSQKFEKIYSELARKHRTRFVPFFLEGLVGNPKMMLADSVHPSPEGHRKLAETLYRALQNYDIPSSTRDSKILSTEKRQSRGSQKN